MNTKQPEIRLISCTEDPVESLFACWAQSRPTQYKELFKYMDEQGYGTVVDKDIVANAVEDGVLSYEDVTQVFKQVIAMSIPVTESISMTWGFSNLPIEWREQAVRKRQWGFWLTSMREFGMDDFVTDGRWTPAAEPIPPEAEKFLADFMLQVEKAYVKLKELGAPQEVARKVVPLCASHNGTMFSNFRTLLDTLSSRSCWISQITLWGPVIEGMVRELSQVHPLLGSVVSPPCFDRFSDDYKGCKYVLINENRLSGKDPYAPCPIYSSYQKPFPELKNDYESWLELMQQSGVGPVYVDQGKDLIQIWKRIWNRNPFTGALLSDVNL